MAQVSQSLRHKRMITARALKTLRIEAAMLRDQLRHVNRHFIRAVELIHQCSGRVVVMGIGKSGLIGRKIAATLSSTGTPSFFLHPAEGLHGDVGMIQKDDVVLALSYSGETEEIRRLLPHLKRLGVNLIGMTGRLASRLAKAANVVVCVSVRQEACPHNLSPTASSTAMLAMGDALATSLMEIKGFKREDYATLHPGGTLGKKLLMTVSEIMRKGIQHPIIKDSTTVQQALLTMTKTRLGATNVVNRQGKLVGFFTDGDLRRSLQRRSDILERPIREFMTRRPLTIRPDQLASAAAEILKQHNFDNIPVVNGKGKPLGIVDERDLLAEGIV